MAPQGTSEVAGVEWYDSGIGFAVPLDAIRERLEQMKQGKDQHAGILGIGLLPRNPRSAAAELAAVRPDSPAGKAGLKKGDRIVELGGRPIRTQTDLRFALGTRYGGDSVEMVVERGDERIERTITLVGELPAFRHAFLGILPLRSIGDRTDESENEETGASADTESESAEPAADAPEESDDGVAVRMVFAESPAERAGIKPGDRIIRISGVAIKSIEAAIGEMNSFAPGNEVALQIVRGDEKLDVKLTATQLTANVPNELPLGLAPADGDGSREAATNGAATEVGGSPEDQKAVEDSPRLSAGETRELKLPEFPQQCRIYVPASRVAGQAQGLLLWLHAPGEANAEQVIRDWQTICDRDGVILVVPTAEEANRWERTEVDYLGRLTKQVLAQYTVDSRRVVVYGEGGGGAMAWLLGLSGREVFRGVATSDSPLPRQVRVPTNEPSQRLAIFAAMPSSNENAVQVAQGLQKCADAGYPVTTITPQAAELSAQDREELARWIDTLDRF
jgi:serine protease Do